MDKPFEGKNPPEGQKPSDGKNENSEIQKNRKAIEALQKEFQQLLAQQNQSDLVQRRDKNSKAPAPNQLDDLVVHSKFPNTDADKTDLTQAANDDSDSGHGLSIIEPATGDKISTFRTQQKIKQPTGEYASVQVLEQIVKMKNGQSICILKMGDQRTTVGLLNANGDYAKPIYRAAAAADPIVETSAFEDQTQVKVEQGQMTFEFPNLDKIVIDKDGVCSIARRMKYFEDHKPAEGKVVLFPNPEQVSFTL
jgi:hypothetical protein